MILSLENRSTGEVEAQLDLAPTLVQANQYLQINLASVLPQQELSVDVAWQPMIDAIESLAQGAHSRVVARDAQLDEPVLQNVQKRLVGVFPASDLVGKAHVSTTDDDGNVVYIVDAQEAVAGPGVSAEQKQAEQEALDELSTLVTFLQKGQQANALLRLTA